jgi:hypothetical protein
VSYDALLIHTVEVRRRGVQQDRFGQPIEPRSDRFADVIYRGRFGERSHDAVVQSAKIYLERGATLAEADQVIVRDRSGAILAGPADITEVTVASDSVGGHHLEAKITATRSGERAQTA